MKREVTIGGLGGPTEDPTLVHLHAIDDMAYAQRQVAMMYERIASLPTVGNEAKNKATKDLARTAAAAKSLELALEVLIQAVILAKAHQQIGEDHGADTMAASLLTATKAFMNQTIAH